MLWLKLFSSGIVPHSMQSLRRRLELVAFGEHGPVHATVGGGDGHRS